MHVNWKFGRSTGPSGLSLEIRTRTTFALVLNKVLVRKGLLTGVSAEDHPPDHVLYDRVPTGGAPPPRPLPQGHYLVGSTADRRSHVSSWVGARLRDICVPEWTGGTPDTQEAPRKAHGWSDPTGSDGGGQLGYVGPLVVVPLLPARRVSPGVRYTEGEWLGEPLFRDGTRGRHVTIDVPGRLQDVTPRVSLYPKGLRVLLLPTRTRDRSGNDVAPTLVQPQSEPKKSTTTDVVPTASRTTTMGVLSGTPT